MLGWFISPIAVTWRTNYARLSASLALRFV
jgi:hypothetical protein